MMKKFFFIELKRIAFSRNVWLVLLLGLFLSVHQYYYYPTIGNSNESFELAKLAGKASLLLPDYLWEAWLGGSRSLIHNYLFFFLLPILATFSCGASYLNDKKNGFIHNILIRVEKKHYYLSKWLVTFFVSGCCVTIPLLVNFLLAMSSYSAMGPYSETFHSAVLDSSMFAAIFFNQPFLYIGLYFLVIFLFSGVYATYSLLATFVSDYKLVILLFPFLIIVLLTNLLSAVDLSFLSPQLFLNPAYEKGNFLIVAIELVVFAVISLVVFLWRGTYEEL